MPIIEPPVSFDVICAAISTNDAEYMENVEFFNYKNSYSEDNL